MLTIIGGVLLCVGVLWYLTGFSFSGMFATRSDANAATVDEHATIRRLLEQSKSETVKQHLRAAGKAMYDE
jgi:DNA-binding GntR family transcriptional regulator